MATALTTTCITLAMLLVSQPLVAASKVRISFLTEQVALRDTLAILKSAGCAPEATDTFKRVVAGYNSSVLDFDFSKFSQATNGYYEFESASKLVAALPHKLADTRHPYDFNCFDTVVSLAADSMRITNRPDDLTDTYLVPYTPTTNSFIILPRATARDAFTLLYVDEYLAATKDILPKAMHDSRITLTAAFFRYHVLPQSTTEQRLDDSVRAALQVSWKRQDMKFPTGFEVVLCHGVNLSQRWFITCHGGLLFPRKGGYTYIEPVP